MDPLNDCPICFETYGDTLEVTEKKVDCCGQSICSRCFECLRRCPFCRRAWHGEDDNAEDGNFWQRPAFPNPLLAIWGTTLAVDVIRSASAVGAAGLRTLITSAAAAAAEASPAVLAGSFAGGVAVTGLLALTYASQHSEEQAERLQVNIRNRASGNQSLHLCVPWRKAAATLWEAICWNLSPQMEGAPHVFHGSPWRSQAQAKHLSQVLSLIGTSNASSSSSSSQTPQAEEQDDSVASKLWADISYCYKLWLDYNPHTANWGACTSYGSSPMFLCWHNRWREDLRHSVFDLARHFAEQADSLDSRQRSCAVCLVAMLDHILSWTVTTLDRGSSDLVSADRWSYSIFCARLKERFAFAWASAMADATAAVEAEGFELHFEEMATRSVPEGFRNLW